MRVIVLGILVAVIVLLVAGAAYSDYYWRKRGFKTVISGSGRDKTKTRVRIDPQVQLPEDPNLLHQDWVRRRDFDEPEAGGH